MPIFNIAPYHLERSRMDPISKVPLCGPKGIQYLFCKTALLYRWMPFDEKSLIPYRSKEPPASLDWNATSELYGRTQHFGTAVVAAGTPVDLVAGQAPADSEIEKGAGSMASSSWYSYYY
jgi:hypothetical protein